MMHIDKFVVQNEQSPFCCAEAAEATKARLFEPENFKKLKDREEYIC